MSACRRSGRRRLCFLSFFAFLSVGQIGCLSSSLRNGTTRFIIFHFFPLNYPVLPFAPFFFCFYCEFQLRSCFFFRYLLPALYFIRFRRPCHCSAVIFVMRFVPCTHVHIYIYIYIYVYVRRHATTNSVGICTYLLSFFLFFLSFKLEMSLVTLSFSPPPFLAVFSLLLVASIQDQPLLVPIFECLPVAV
uniref:Uncharacterized protein TCIL3000_5_840 n=1 Tax=Trypanosoma congolense (strain IL3000) TaxID=1068625 RepID=G0UMI4_TRYCI|nr:unnamed protein product [Trypanosoma congolense IL3000]